jgi:hypothetical protein
MGGVGGWFHRNSSPMPTCTPFRTPSDARAASGTPKLSSTRTGSNMYIRPTPAETDGLLSADRGVDDDELLPTDSSWPALRNPWALTGQSGLWGRCVMTLAPAAQNRSPPSESAGRVVSMGVHERSDTYCHHAVRACSRGTYAGSSVRPAGSGLRASAGTYC